METTTLETISSPASASGVRVEPEASGVTAPIREDQKRPQVPPNHDFAAELAFTRVYREHLDSHPAIREARCIQAQLPHILAPIRPGDLLAGRLEPALVGFTPDEWGQCAFGYYGLPDQIDEALEQSALPAQRRREVEEMRDFWKTEGTAAKVRAAYPDDLARSLPSDDWMGEPGVAFPLYRLTGGTPNYDRLLRWGIPGLRERIEALRIRNVQWGAQDAEGPVRRAETIGAQAQHATEPVPASVGPDAAVENDFRPTAPCAWRTPSDAANVAAAVGADVALYDGMNFALDALSEACRFYARRAWRDSVSASGRRLEDLIRMAETLEGLPNRAPRCFREAIQLFWLYSIVGDIRNHGRLDVALGDFLVDDLNSGALTPADALRLLQSLWALMADRNTRVHNRIIIGGRGRRNPENADRFAELAIEASRTVLEAEPQLSLRFYGGMSPALMDQALDTIGAGRTFPMLYNDDVNIPAVMEAFGLEREVAEQYVPFGCGEYVIQGLSFGTPSGVINLLKALDVTIHDGVEPASGRAVGLRLGRLEQFESFNALWTAYERQVEHYVDLLARQQKIEYEIAGHEAPFLFLSMLYDDCMERGRGMFDGGVRYLGGTLETYGNANTADSLAAIKKCVYDDKTATPEELLLALDADFTGFEKLRRRLTNAPKYGNDDDEADEMLVRVHEHVCRYARSRARKVGLDSYLVVIINNSANTLLGRQTPASADGRRAGMPMNNGNNPASGADRSGVTAFLNSIVKPSTAIHAGAVQNMKFSGDLFGKYRPQLEALLQAYFEMGGAQAMITVVNREELEAAIRRPADYQHLFVRVGGFSARFVDLPRDVQQEILERTLY